MDCKLENAARTLVRIEILILQGLLRGIAVFLTEVCLIPTVPLLVAILRIMETQGRLNLPTRLLLISKWTLVDGLWIALSSPFRSIANTICDTVEIVRVEWNTRWMHGEPKRPDGHPLDIRSADDEARMGMAATLSVVRDYNAEARMYGQGLPIDETKL